MIMLPQPPLKVIRLDFSTIEIFDNYLVSTIDEDTVFDRYHLEQFYEVFDTNFYKRPFGYISNRKNEYTINPTCYLNSAESPWLAAMAILCTTERAYNSALFERKFYKNRPFKPFYDSKECLNWLTNKIDKHNEDRPPVSL